MNQIIAAGFGLILFASYCSPVCLADEPSYAERWKALEPYFQPPKTISGADKYRSPLLFADGHRVATPAEWVTRRQEILKTWHGLMGPWPPLLTSPKVERLDRDQVDGVTRQHVRIEVAPGRLTDDAYLMIPAGKGPFPAVVVVYYDAKTGVGLGKNPLRDFALRLARRGFVTLSLGSPPESYYPDKAHAQVQPLSYHAYVAANCHTILAQQPNVDAKRIGIVGHSYGGKWAMFASCLYDKFAAAAWSDGGVVFDERRPNVNYWEPWYLGYEPGYERKRGVLSAESPRTGPYKRMIAEGRDLHELHALMAPRPFLVSGGAEDQPERWAALSHAVAVNQFLGYTGRVGMTNRPTHAPTEESNAQIDTFFERFLKHDH